MHYYYHMARPVLRRKFVPRIYCLTVPGSGRHHIMRNRLDALNTPYEFVYGEYKPTADTIPWKCVDRCEAAGFDKHNIPTGYYRGVYGCQRGMAKLLQKGVDDSAPWFIVCQDDVTFTPGIVEEFVKQMSILPEDVGMLATCYYEETYQMTDFTKLEHFYSVGKRKRLEWCFAIRRWFAREYIDSLNSYGAESDICIERWCMDSGRKVYATLKRLAERSKESYNSLINSKL